ncbi:amino acid ABC transporter permease, partial [Candidatus Aerophobetes bacterium]|nr:amino acid ABC transporter permease [Candidatus Aerophobetes bacterium]
LPTLHVDLDPNSTALLVLTLNMGAYTTEIIRGGIESIHKSQIEAGYSLGMNYLKVFRYVILPPAMKAIAPPLSNQVIMLILASVLVAQISAQDLFYQATLLEARIFRSFEVFLVTGAIYFGLVEALYLFFSYINKKLFRYTPRERFSSTL